MAAPGENLKIDGARLWDSIMEMAKIGPGVAGGNNRQTLTDADAEGRELFRRWCEAAGMTLGVDAMGTMFATREGEDPEALPVYVGSHLDTQPTGGKYDGVLGVLGALEVIRSMNDLGIRTRHPIVVTNWTNEEGARFAPAMLASGVFAGVHELDYAYARTDLEGKSVRGGARADRLEGRRGGGRAQDARLFRAAHRAGADPRGRGQGDRRRHPLPGALVARVHPDRQGGAYRVDADGDAGERRAGDGADLRDGAGGRDGGAAGRGGRGRAGDVQPELAQRAAGARGLHRRHPLARPGEARSHAGADRGARRRGSARRSASAARSSRSGISIR